VVAEILVLRQHIALDEARDMLWRRETRRVGTGEQYRRPTKPTPNQVLVEEFVGLGGLETVLYTDFPPEGKVSNPNPARLAKAAIRSVAESDPDRDGITYLMKAKSTGIATRLTTAYEAEILRLSGTSTLAEARELARSR
jgi:hypothetical protein